MCLSRSRSRRYCVGVNCVALLLAMSSEAWAWTPGEPVPPVYIKATASQTSLLQNGQSQQSTLECFFMTPDVIGRFTGPDQTIAFHANRSARSVKYWISTDNRFFNYQATESLNLDEFLLSGYSYLALLAEKRNGEPLTSGEEAVISLPEIPTSDGGSFVPEHRILWNQDEELRAAVSVKSGVGATLFMSYELIFTDFAEDRLPRAMSATVYSATTREPDKVEKVMEVSISEVRELDSSDTLASSIAKMSQGLTQHRVIEEAEYAGERPVSAAAQSQRPRFLFYGVGFLAGVVILVLFGRKRSQ